MLRHTLDRLYYYSALLAASCIVMICLIVSAQVSLNLIDKIALAFFNTALGLTIPSYADFTGFLLTGASFLALAWTLRSGGHIRVTLLTSLSSATIRRYADILAVLIVLIISAFMSYYVLLLLLESYQYNDLSPGMIAVPLWLPQTTMVLGSFILTIALIDELMGLLTQKKPSSPHH